MIPDPIIGTGLHAVGGIAASTCYTPFEKISKWSWTAFWLVQAFFAWIVVPLILGIITVPHFFTILAHAPTDALWQAFLLGGLYGFGGMSFGFAIKHIGYSLTYTISIGISAVFGTITPMIINGTLIKNITEHGGSIMVGGMVIAILGVAICGYAGFRKDNEAKDMNFNMLLGLTLAIIGGLLSAVFNLSLVSGRPIANMAANQGASIFQKNAEYIVSTSGCFVVNLIWFLFLGFRQNKLNELLAFRKIGLKQFAKNYGLSALAGTLWMTQFFFFGLGQVFLEKFSYIGWLLHMTMLVFFGFIVGLFVKEWREVSNRTFYYLIGGLVVLFISFVIISYGTT